MRFFKFINPLKFYFSKKKKQRKTKSDIKKIFKELEYNWFIIQDIQKITKYPDALTDSGIKAMQSINQTLKLNKYELFINGSFEPFVCSKKIKKIDNLYKGLIIIQKKINFMNSVINIPNNSLDFEDEKRTLKFQLEWYYLGYLNIEEKIMEYIENSDVRCLV